jgi:hypothetical protein
MQKVDNKQGRKHTTNQSQSRQQIRQKADSKPDVKKTTKKSATTVCQPDSNPRDTCDAATVQAMMPCNGYATGGDAAKIHNA